jgi:C1A family cysteine protease
MQINYVLLFAQFIQLFNRSYPDFDIQSRFLVFKDNVYNIFEHNAKNSSFKLEINQFTDYYPNELALLRNDNRSIQKTLNCKEFTTSTLTSLPDSVDWRTKDNIVSPVKDQAQCGSCWAFATVEAVESALALKGKGLQTLSPQELVDCSSSYGNYGCSGGIMDRALDFIIDNGVCSESEYSYTASDNTCKQCAPVASISDCQDIPSNNQLLLKEAVSIQPVIVAIEADRTYFQFYKSGILDSTLCGTNLDHAVVVVGYGEEDGQKYWIVRNSWGTSWGDNGYVKILRSESTNDSGICGIAMNPSIPIV